MTTTTTTRATTTTLIETGSRDYVEMNQPANETLDSLVEIPGREYELGSSEYTHPLNKSRKVILRGFRISPTEVSNAEYRLYVQATGAPVPYCWASPYDKALDDYPVTGITWDEANRYCRWRGARLPTPNEWEAASKGPGGSKYPWGEKSHPDIKRFEVRRWNQTAYEEFARPTTSAPHLATPKGLFHMLSNVQEYTEGIAEDRSGGLILKGRSWASSPYLGPWDVSTFSRNTRAFDRGFRIAISTNNQLKEK